MAKEKWFSKGKVVSMTLITPSDTVLNEYDALYVGGTGNLAVKARDDSTAVTLAAISVGWHPVSVKYVMATNTTATNIVGAIVEE